ncbi:ankyrin repeat domain-containing protein [Aspergillus glaucus CBS 516.65]|uniref:Uncharacterized protein n=1 Tax=Aspergillus glaucus CBS 516.65 TaxID=1160497 RepID=A0A1L9VI32_ASPGL|nr:hypothetical protein ASPGLDRAFT_413792 [Aspergillus glaucus CBS 516.65]OJJ83579.1 hypothetical protein ASPGLDRAFT_413792 [Aspergillus glaucus CBS 516.65]
MESDRKDKFAIHEAAREGNVQTIESLLSANPRLARTKDDDDRLPIHWAVSYNRLPVVELLVSQKNFDPDVEDGSGWTPLMIAASLRDAEGDPIIEQLLQKEADVNVKSTSGQNALHFATSKINITTVRLLLTNKCSARVKDKRGQLPLHRAAAVGSVPIMKMLLEEGKSPVNATDMDGLTALHHAVAEGLIRGTRRGNWRLIWFLIRRCGSISWQIKRETARKKLFRYPRPQGPRLNCSIKFLIRN